LHGVEHPPEPFVRTRPWIDVFAQMAFRVGDSARLAIRFLFELRTDRVGDAIGRERAFDQEVVERHQTDQVIVVDERDAPDVANPHQLGGALLGQKDRHGSNSSSHDVSQTGFFGIEPAPHDAQSEVAIGHDSGELSAILDQNGADVVGFHRARRIVDGGFRILNDQARPAKSLE
jgi:hypothetical protein